MIGLNVVDKSLPLKLYVQMLYFHGKIVLEGIGLDWIKIEGKNYPNTKLLVSREPKP